MFLYTVNPGGGLVPASTFMVPRILLCTGAVLGDGPPRVASVSTTFCNTHVKQHNKLHTFHPSSNLVHFHFPLF